MAMGWKLAVVLAMVLASSSEAWADPNVVEANVTVGGSLSNPKGIGLGSQAS